MVWRDCLWDGWIVFVVIDVDVVAGKEEMRSAGGEGGRRLGLGLRLRLVVVGIF